MNARWKLPQASTMTRWVRQTRGKLPWIAGGGASVALVLLSCSTVTNRTIVAPPSIPGATFVGSEACAQCHEKVTRDFKTADHAKLMAKGSNAKDMGCESCHGAGSKHVDAGGGAGTIVNPGKSSETCFQCHLDKKAEFSMPFAHPVLQGKMTCSDCHDPHKGSAMKGGGTSLAGRDDTCFECHSQQQGPFVFPHDAVREGCSSCHNPHGSVNPRMLTERNSNLCLKCHFQTQTGKPPTDAVMIGGGNHSASRLNRGTCWSAGCHEAVHGSNVSAHLRN